MRIPSFWVSVVSPATPPIQYVAFLSMLPTPSTDNNSSSSIVCA